MSESPAIHEGVVSEVLPNATYRVALANGQSVIAHVGAGIRMHTVRIIAGDQVTVELTSRDSGRARIVRRAGSSGR